MRIVFKINLVLLTLLSLATGAVKLASMPEEMALFRGVGFTDPMTWAFGVVQLAGGLLLLSPRTRRAGAGILIPTFLFATYALFVASIFPFAPLSLLFVAMAALPLLPDRLAAPGATAPSGAP